LCKYPMVGEQKRAKAKGTGLGQGPKLGEGGGTGAGLAKRTREGHIRWGWECGGTGKEYYAETNRTVSD